MGSEPARKVRARWETIPGKQPICLATVAGQGLETVPAMVSLGILNRHWRGLRYTLVERQCREPVSRGP